MYLAEGGFGAKWNIRKSKKERTPAPTQFNKSEPLNSHIDGGRGGASVGVVLSLSGLLLIDFHREVPTRVSVANPLPSSSLSPLSLFLSVSVFSSFFSISLTSLNFNMKTTSTHRVGRLHGKRVAYYVKEMAGPHQRGKKTPPFLSLLFFFFAFMMMPLYPFSGHRERQKRKFVIQSGRGCICYSHLI